MMDRRPIIDDPRFIAGVRGERYAVLLARGDVLAACDEAQGALRERLAGLDVVYPRAHLTLASFARGTEIREVQAALDRWAGATAPVSLRLERIAAFGPPHQVVYATTRKTAPLERAYARLRRESRLRGLAPVGGEGGSTDQSEWLPHLSLAYCDRLADASWERAVSAAGELSLTSAECLVPAIDLVTYDARGEQLIASIPLRAGRHA